MNTKKANEVETKKLTFVVIFMSMIVFVVFGFIPTA
ncbi:hypothetical protein MNBD_GAMMA05-2530 [hydrothermal vent metagenome]|uniref:Uncharacterized protein n=1 Tax=hydrothermal vent metagenome TaxID=652676 RepID=A0A3B0WJK5_9ZZZZ